MNTSLAASNTAPKKEILDISSMLLPLEGRYLLLPGVAVAEIVTFVAPESENYEGTPPWFLGHIFWRNLRIPMISYEAMIGAEVPLVSPHCRIAVMNNTGLNHQLEFFAVLLQGTPRLLRLSSEDVSTNNEKICDSGEALHVQVLGDEAVVPDIAYMERNLIRYLELT